MYPNPYMISGATKTGILSKGLSSLKAINWGGLLEGTQKTLGVINQAIPVVAYEMLVTGESTGQLGLMMEKVADHFQALHKSVIDQLKSLMEPLMICALAVVVGIILLSIVQPMFSIYGQME